jgi:uncharacterized protein
MDFTLCLTHACNLRCEYCYAGPKSNTRMSWDVARQAIDFALDYSLRRATLLGTPPEAQIGYFGGEPLIEWPLLTRSADYALKQAAQKGLPLKKTVTTNMTLLDEEKMTWFRAHDFYLGLSLDGNAAMHDTLRRFPDGTGSHAAASRALRFFRGPQPTGEIILVVDPRNVAHLAKSVEWLLTEDIRNMALNPNFYIEWPETALRTWQTASERIGDLYIDAYRAGQPVRINVIDGKIRTRIKDGYAPCDRCGFGENEIAIAASGNIYPCERIVGDDTNKDLCLGTIFTGFDSAQRARILACRGNIIDECKDCPVRERCMNWCACINYATTGAINRVDGLVCHHERMVIGVADRVGSTLFAESNPAFLARFYGA